MASFQSQLLPATFRGIPFGVRAGDASFGRRNAVHEYPYRDVPWVEDLGRSARRIRVHGFVVGDDAIARRAKILEVAEAPGDGELVHPTLGRKQVALLDLQTSETWDQGRVFELTFVFIEQGLREFPADQKLTSDAARSAADSGVLAAAKAFSKRVGAYLQQGAVVLARARAAASAWGDIAIDAANNAASLKNLVDTTTGSIGRISGLTAALSTVSSLIGASAVARQNVTQSAALLVRSAETLTVELAPNHGLAAGALVEAVRSATARPMDAILAMQALAGFSPVITADASPTGIALAAVDSASRDLFRRAAVAGAARSAVEYQPTSNDDAAAMRDRVLSLIDAEITTAGDQGEDDTFMALRALRSAVSQDLNARGAALPDVVLITSTQPMPSLALAQRLYRDASRSSELELEAGAIHPAFMPTQFRGLSA